MASNVQSASLQKLAQVNEQTWLQLGSVAEMMQDYDRAINAYESAIRHNNYSIQALGQIAALCRAREQFPKAVEYFQRILNIDQTNGEIWGALGHCFLMMDDLQKAYSAYQQALYHLPNPKEPKLWYGIGILYDRYGSLDHAEEAFSQVMNMEPKFEKANEIYFRLGIIYKQQQKYDQSLACFRYILQNPPRPLTEVDIWFQIGHVHEQQKNYIAAKEDYERVLQDNPNHAKVLQQLGWLYHQTGTSFANQDLAIQFLTKSLESEANDAQSWYLLGRCYMAQQKYNKAYEAYQQAVYRDGRNPTFWCSIGVLYYQINQFRDALDAYSRAIRLNPYISEVWYDLGTLYESCNNQISDALDAYQRAAELDPHNLHIKQRLQLLRNQQAQGGQTTAPAAPQDVNPQAYQNNPSPMMSNPPQFAQPAPGPPGPPPMPGYGGSMNVDNRQKHPLPINFPDHGPTSRDLPPMNPGRRSPGPSGNPYHNLPSHLPPTSPPNQQHTLNPMMPPPHDAARQLPPQSQPPPLRHPSEKPLSPPPQIPPISEDRPPRNSRYSPPSLSEQPVRPSYNLNSPKLSAPEQYASSSHSTHHQSHPASHHDILNSSPMVEPRREPPEMYDPTKVKGEDSVNKHGNGAPTPYHINDQSPLSNSHESHSSHHHNEYPSQIKPEDSMVSNNLDHGGASRAQPPSPSQLMGGQHQTQQHAHPPPPPDHVGSHRLHEPSVEEKGVPMHSFHQDDPGRRNSTSGHLPEIKSLPPVEPLVQRPQDSPVRENGSFDLRSPISNSNNELPPITRKSSSSSDQQHSNRELPKPNILNEEPSPRSPSEPRSQTLNRIHENSATSPTGSMDESVKLPAIRNASSSSDRPTSSRLVDEDYDDTKDASDALISMRESRETVTNTPSSNNTVVSPTSPQVLNSSQKRPYSPTRGETDPEDRSRDEVNTKRSKNSPTTRPSGTDEPHPLPTSSSSTSPHQQERERDRDRDQEREQERRDRVQDREQRERRKSEQSANGSSSHSD